jgi:hypothetical protein
MKRYEQECIGNIAKTKTTYGKYNMKVENQILMTCPIWGITCIQEEKAERRMIIPLECGQNV